MGEGGFYYIPIRENTPAGSPTRKDKPCVGQPPELTKVVKNEASPWGDK